MRILHSVHDSLAEQVAGVEVYTSRVSRRQAEHDPVGVLFATLDPRRVHGSLELGHDEKVESFSVAQNRFWSRFEHSWRDPRMIPAIARALDLFRPNVLHVQHLMNLGLGVIEEATRRRIPIVMTLHDHWLACANGGQRFRASRERCDDLEARRCARCTDAMVGPALALRGGAQRRAAARREAGGDWIREGATDGPLSATRMPGETVLRPIWSRVVGATGTRRIESRWRAMRALASRVDRFLSPSQDLAEALVDFGLPAARVRVVPHGVPRSGGARARSLPERATRFAYLGSLVPHKGVHDLVRAFDGLPDGLRLDLFGSWGDDPRYVGELRALASHPGIRFRGEVPPAQVPDRLAAIDGLVAPSIWRENAPLGVLEALAAGRPVVASDLGGHRELLAEGGGLLFEAGNVEALSRCLRRLAEEPGLGPALVAAARVPPTLDAHVASLGEIYREVIAERARDGAPRDARPTDGAPRAEAPRTGASGEGAAGDV